MNRLDADTLAVVLPSQTARCKMTCVSNYFAVMLRSLVESYRARAVRRVTWKEKKLVIRLHLNAPHTLRLVWRSFGTTKELRINMLTVTSAGRIMHRRRKLPTCRHGDDVFYHTSRRSQVFFSFLPHRCSHPPPDHPSSRHPFRVRPAKQASRRKTWLYLSRFPDCT